MRLAPRTVAEVGDRIGRWTLVSPLGAGGFASVWRARAADGLSPHEAALKVMHPKLAEMRPHKGPTPAERFLAEAKVMASLPHPGIVRVGEIIEDASRDTYAYTMELLAGRDLAVAVADLDLPDILTVCRQVAEVLAFIHHNGVIHRDVKLRNVFICDGLLERDPQSAVKLIDFGIAKEVYLGAMLERTATGHFVGTVSTMAPETLQRLSGEDVTLTGAVDQWSLGIALFAALSGAEPFRGTTVFEVMAQIQAAPTPPLLLRAGLRAAGDLSAIERLIARMLAKDPERRYPDMDAVNIALDAAIAQATGTARPRVFSALLRSTAPSPSASALSHALAPPSPSPDFEVTERAPPGAAEALRRAYLDALTETGGPTPTRDELDEGTESVPGLASTWIRLTKRVDRDVEPQVIEAAAVPVIATPADHAAPPRPSAAPRAEPAARAAPQARKTPADVAVGRGRTWLARAIAIGVGVGALIAVLLRRGGC